MRAAVNAPVAAPAVSAPFAPSAYQAAIFEWTSNGSGNAIVHAVAGSGKTTTVVQTLKRTSGEAIFLAFNKSIAEELKARVPAHCAAKTFHSLCYGPVTRAFKVRNVEKDKLLKLVGENWSDLVAQQYGAFARKLVGLARGVGIGCLVPDVEQSWWDLVEQHDLTLESESADLTTGVARARELLALSNAAKEVDFDDLLYFAVAFGIRLPVYDWVFVDEAQDTNPIQRAILRKILRPGTGRLVAVGDPAQAIYGFRGADAASMRLIQEEFEAQKFPLSVSYRCARAIVERARQYVPEIEPAEGAPEGAVRHSADWKLTDFAAADLVVCRQTKPVIQLGYRLLRAKIPCRILGREIGEGLVSLVKKMRAGSVDELESRVGAWRDREVQKAIAKRNEALADRIADKAECVITLARELPEDARTVEALLGVLNELFTDSNHRLTLSTIHKAKGLEADRVWWLAPSLCPSKWAKQEWQKEQERNLMYVAVTRAKRELVTIEMEKKERL
jgi:DNA helicase II / ATP-dependent DNA helicase PcrA